MGKTCTTDFVPPALQQCRATLTTFLMLVLPANESHAGEVAMLSTSPRSGPSRRGELRPLKALIVEFCPWRLRLLTVERVRVQVVWKGFSASIFALISSIRLEVRSFLCIRFSESVDDPLNQIWVSLADILQFQLRLVRLDRNHKTGSRPRQSHITSLGQTVKLSPDK